MGTGFNSFILEMNMLKKTEIKKKIRAANSGVHRGSLWTIQFKTSLQSTLNKIDNVEDTDFEVTHRQGIEKALADISFLILINNKKLHVQ